jgi:hypothetical protein
VEGRRYVAQVFAEALIAEQGVWDQVQSLADFEKHTPKKA